MIPPDAERGHEGPMAKKKTNGANLGFEEKLWAAADKLRGHVDAAKLKGQFSESSKLEQAILTNLASLGFTGKEPT